MGEAACGPGSEHDGMRVDPEWWFPLPGAMRRTTRTAISICNEVCLVRVECLAYATRHELAGIWAGKTEKERYGRHVEHKPRYIEEEL